MVTDVKEEEIEIATEKPGAIVIPQRVRRTRYVVLIEESFRGDLEKGTELSILEGVCRYRFENQTRYLVYAMKVDGKLDVSICSRTRPLSMADEDLKYIRGLNDNSPKGIIYGLILNQTKDANGYNGLRSPPNELTVIAEGSAGEVRTLTYRAGYFEINNLPPGTYRIRVEDARSKNVRLRALGQVQSTNHIPVMNKEGTEVIIVVINLKD
ncbi:MAG: hypothetical protein L0220_19075 [Acidobacteria bacterium]|nr:hypothetical protein [Acidobacteriota bacterium]